MNGKREIKAFALLGEIKSLAKELPNGKYMRISNKVDKVRLLIKRDRNEKGIHR